jgi:hypothetical protein
MPIDGGGEQLRTLAERLKDAGAEGQGFRRELLKQLGDAAKPLARVIAGPERLKPYMPDRYAAVLAADLSVTTQRLFAGSSPRISIVAKGRVRKRKVARLEDGFISHPVFAQGPRRKWNWKGGNLQTGGMKPGWFSDPCEKAAPDIREHVLEAMAETARKISDGG